MDDPVVQIASEVDFLSQSLIEQELLQVEVFFGALPLGAFQVKGGFLRDSGFRKVFDLLHCVSGAVNLFGADRCGGASASNQSYGKQREKSDGQD